MVILLGVAALAIDIGNLLIARNELQNSADAAARRCCISQARGRSNAFVHDLRRCGRTAGARAQSCD
ncbi:Tad domain-containing protein [Burkholderia ubonensis]|uniref:pilus assembly protein TadG-related protein n=2 Tax=Burkholderia ubonensis TaxID=101571 RepID=UPI000A4445DD